MEKHISSSSSQTQQLGQALGETLTGGEIVAFTGGLGAGKTTFCKGLARGLGVQDAISSPTFAIANVYSGRVLFAHFDAYRIGSEEDLMTAGFYDYLDDGAVVAVEWSENVRQALPQPIILVDIQPVGENQRRIQIERKGEAARP